LKEIDRPVLLIIHSITAVTQKKKQVNLEPDIWFVLKKVLHRDWQCTETASAQRLPVHRDCQCLGGKYLGKFSDQLKKIMVIGELKQT
jgi:hypothetical protein